MTGFKDNGSGMFTKEAKVLGAPEVAKGSVPIIGMATSIASGITGTTPIPALLGKGVSID